MAQIIRDASRTSYFDGMVPETMCNVVAVRLEQFAAGGRVGVIPKSLTNDADNTLNDKFGVRLHRLDFSVVERLRISSSWKRV